MKTFVLGLILGAFVCFTVVRLMDLHSREALGLEQLPTSPIGRSILKPGEQSSCSDTESRIPVANSSGGERTASQPAPSIPSAVERRRTSIDDLTEKEAFEVCERASELRQEREQAAKDAEPKDAGWAYPMEQQIRQHVEPQLPADQYSTLKVECRSAFCELEMRGTGDEGRELADKVASTIQNQPWSDIEPRGQSSGADGTDWYIEYEWHRPRTESDR